MHQKLTQTIIGGAFFLISIGAHADTAKQPEIEAYHLMEESPFNRDVFKISLETINSAYKKNQNNPWVYITYSLATLQQGYNIGTWYHYSSYNDGVVDKALELATRANQLGENESQTYANLAKIYIIKTDYKKAWGLLNKAYQLDNKNYYAWFYKAIINIYLKNYKRAQVGLEAAGQLTKHKYQIKLITRQLQNIAKATGDKELEEKMYKKNISDFPENAYMYGNYAAFLYKNKRYEEAVKYYKKTVSISPYPNALKWLERSKQKAGIK